MRFLGIFLLSMVMTGQALACRCMPPNDETAKEAYNEADVIVVGQVVAASDGWNALGPLLQLNVQQVLKGEDIPDFITANYNNNYTACGQTFEPNEIVTLALYDTRDVQLREDNARGYGFRVMISCHQIQIRHFVETVMDKKEK